jgi:hypothetical protein
MTKFYIHFPYPLLATYPTHLILIDALTLIIFGEDIARSIHTHNVREPFGKFVDWQQCAAVMQREEVTVMPCCGGGDNIVVA